MDIGERLKYIRTKDLETQNDIAKLLGISRSTYKDYESQHKIIPSKYLFILANHYNTSVDYILGLTDIEYCDCFKKDINVNTVAKRIKEFRTIFKLTQQELADSINADRSAFSYYEQGKYLIPTYFIYEICKKYHISADWLLGRIDNINGYIKTDN